MTTYSRLLLGGSPVYPEVTGSQALHCFWCYSSAHTCRPVAWLLPVKAGLCLHFQRNTQRVHRLILPTSGTAPLERDGFTVELLPKLAFFTLWDRPPSSGLVHEMILRAGCPVVVPPAVSLNPRRTMRGGACPAVLQPDGATPADEAPADEAQAPIDLVSETS